MVYNRSLANAVADLTASRDHLQAALDRIPRGNLEEPQPPARQVVLEAQRLIRRAVGLLIDDDWESLWNLTADTRRPEDKP